jgi:hypothetical protein
MVLQFIHLPAFITSFAIGMFIVYIITGHENRKILVYPTPENVELLLYRDNANNCYKMSQTEVPCPRDPSKISKIPAQ